MLILFSILQYFSPFLFFLSGLAVKRIRYLYFANSFFDLFLNRNIINLDEFEIKDSSSFELVLFKSTYFRKLYEAIILLPHWSKFTTFPNKEVERQQNLA